MKHLNAKSFYYFIFSVFLCGLWSCSRQAKPVEDPAYILTSPDHFWKYWSSEVKLSIDFTANDENNNRISGASFLKQLLSGKYLPLLLRPDSSNTYELYKIHNPSKDISGMLKYYSSIYYQFYKMEGKPLPGFNFVDLNGNLYNRQTCKGKIIVMNFWFIECSTCVDEMPALNALVESYKDRKDIVFVSLAPNPADQLRGFLTKNTFHYAVVPAKRHYLLDTLKINEFPTHLIIGKNGLVANLPEDYDQLRVALGKEAQN